MRKKENLDKRILLSITGRTEKEWKDKIKEIEKRKITRVALFLSCYKKSQRKKIFKALLKSGIKEIPLVHLRNGMDIEEIKFLIKNYNSEYLTIHESSFRHLEKWKGFYKKLCLELDYNNYVPKNVLVKKIKGFCIDLSHFKADEERWTKEFEYILKRKKHHEYFVCNHLNGFSYKKLRDIHVMKNLKDFDYLKTLPNFVFGKIIAIETWNSIKDQIKFKKYVLKILKEKNI